MIDELRAGLRGVTEEIMHAARAGHASCAAESVHGEEDAAGCRRFSELMAAFHVDAATRFCALEVRIGWGGWLLAAAANSLGGWARQLAW